MHDFQEFGRQGGLKGGPARMRGLSEQERSELGRAGAKSRWQKRREAVQRPRLHHVVTLMLNEIERTGQHMVLFRDDGRFFFHVLGSTEEKAATVAYGGSSIMGTYGPGGPPFSKIVRDALED